MSGILAFVSRIILFTFLLLSMLSCAGRSPHELKSPCVSIESANPYFRSPCVKRPVNGRELA